MEKQKLEERENMMVSEHIITTDVLVIGAGMAGCFAAIRALELNMKVTIAEQNVGGFVGKTSMGTNIHRVVLPEDDHDMALKGTVLQCDYMVDQEYAEGAIAETYDRFQDVIRMGASFRKNFKGEIDWMIMDTQYPEFKQRQAIWEPYGSYKHINKFKAEAVRRGAEIMDRCVVTDLLTKDGKAVGAVGVNKRDGGFYIFKAKAVVIATADFNAAGSIHAAFTGDGMGMALRAGAELRGMEFGRIGFGVDWPDDELVTAAEKMMREERNTSEQRVRIINARGEEFLEQYEQLYRKPGRLYGGPSWKSYIPAIVKENKEGRGPCYWDVGPVKFEIGYNQKISPQNGGIRIDPQGCTTVPGLFAGGIASDMCGAVHFSIPYNLMGSSITGRRAGESAANYARENPLVQADEGEIARLKKETYAPLGRETGVTEQDIRLAMIDAWPYLECRTEETLTKAYDLLRAIEQDIPALVASDPHELTKCLKVRNVVQLAQAGALAARERKESRLEHYRDDYPLMDNKNWLKWVIVKGTGESMAASAVDIPIEKWKYRPEPALVDRLERRKDNVQ